MKIENRITKSCLKKLQVARTFFGDTFIKCVDFEYNGETFVANCENIISVYQLLQDRVERQIVNVSKTKAGLSTFYNLQHILYSALSNSEVRLLDWENRHHICYYKGHSDEILSLCAASTFFASSSKDKTVKIWDPMVANQCRISKVFPTAPLICLNSLEATMAVAYSSSIIELFDTKDFRKAVHSFEIGKRSGLEWTSIKFSPNNEMLMITTNSSLVFIINPISGKEMHNLTGFSNPSNEAFDACFSLDSCFAFSGSSDGIIHVWDLNDSSPILRMKNVGSCHRVQFNPTLMNLVTTSDGSNINLWIENNL